MPRSLIFVKMKGLWACVGIGPLLAQMWVRIEGYERGAWLPPQHTCDGANVPLSIQWGGAPSSTRAFVVRLYDPDAPQDTFIHWLVCNVKGTQLGPNQEDGLVGYNDFGKVGYGGPSPPVRDPAHRYVAEVYALSEPLNVRPPITWEKVRSLLAARTLARAETFVRYQRKK